MEIIYNDFIKENVAPNNAAYMSVLDENGKEFGKINIDKMKFPYGDKLYSFGVLSDIHHDYSYDYDYFVYNKQLGPQSASDLANALKYYKEHNTDFVCICGDLTVQAGETATAFDAQYFLGKEEAYSTPSHLSDLDSFKYNIENVNERNIPVFIARGNHDIGSINASTQTEITERECTNKDDLWKYYAEPKNYDENKIEMHCHDDYFKQYYFIKKDTDDVFIFISNDYNNNKINEQYPCFNEDTLSWLEDTIKKYSDENYPEFIGIKRCFLFSHNFFENQAGDGHFSHEGGGESKYTYWRTLFESDCYAKMKELNETYDNLIWFTGHSHINLKLQGEGFDKCTYNNISKFNENSAWNVHVPSGAYPRNSYINNENYKSQGLLVDVYNDYIIVNGICFKENDKIVPTRYLKAENIIIDKSKAQYRSDQKVEQLDDNYVEFTFTNKSGQRFIINDENEIKSETSSILYVEVEDIKIYSNEKDITYVFKGYETTKNTSCLAFYVNDSKYTLKSCYPKIVNLTYEGEKIYGGQFSTSSSQMPSTFKGYPLTILLKAKIITTSMNEYCNKLIPKAIYKLDTKKGG